MAKEKKELIVGINGDLSDNFTTPQKAILGLQNTLAMCGVILVPILCGLDVSVTLFCAGIGTIIYQFIDKKMVPAFLGGSFAIIAGVSTVVGEMGIPYAQGGILGMAVFYLLFALLLKILGKDRVARVFPPIIVGPIIMVLGLSLASVGVQEAEANWPIAIITFLIAVGVNNFSKGLTRAGRRLYYLHPLRPGGFHRPERGCLDRRSLLHPAPVQLESHRPHRPLRHRSLSGAHR